MRTGRNLIIGAVLAVSAAGAAVAPAVALAAPAVTVVSASGAPASPGYLYHG